MKYVVCWQCMLEAIRLTLVRWKLRSNGDVVVVGRVHTRLTA